MSKYNLVVIASHVDPSNPVRSGPVLPLLEYFASRSKYVALIGQPAPYCNDARPYLQVYSNGVLLTHHTMWCPLRGGRENKTSVMYKLRDFVAVLLFKGRVKQYGRVDWFIGVESVNAVAGLRWGAGRVVYYVFDWSPKWFGSRWRDWLYRRVDRVASSESSVVWDITGVIEEERGRWGYKSKKEVVVPYCVRYKRKLVPMKPHRPLDTVVYCGYQSTENGANLLPRIRELLEAKGKHLKVVTDLNDPGEVDREVVQAHIGIAPYVLRPYSKKRFGDVIKVRHYLACGLPVVVSADTPVAREVEAELLGFTVRNHNPTNYVQLCVYLLNNYDLYCEIRMNVIRKAKKVKWDAVFDRGTKL